MRLLLATLVLGAGLALIGRSERKVAGLLPKPDAPREPESWLAAEVEAYSAKH